MQSSPGRKPVMTVMPSASAEKSTARWERLLSPGTLISPPKLRIWRTVRIEAGGRLISADGNGSRRGVDGLGQDVAQAFVLVEAEDEVEVFADEGVALDVV